MKTILTTLTLVAVALGTQPAEARKVHLKQPFTATAADPDARGLGKLALTTTSDGKFEVKIQRLDSNAVYELLVNGVRVADITTSGGGNGKVRFRTRPRSDRDLALGFDPRAATIVVRDAAGDDVLAESFPDDQPNDAGDVVCCIPDDSGPECEDRTADECAAAGGTVVAGATSCLPNPCEGAPPVVEDVVCCIPDDSGAECEDRTQAECLAAGGTVVEATSCDPDPCAATPPAAGDVVCCLPDRGGDGENECEDLTADACTAAGGAVSTATSCTPDPCNATPPPAPAVCCLPDTNGDGAAECEDRTADECTAAGGTPSTATSCTPDPCNTTPPPGQVACCVPTTGGEGAECEMLTTDACTTAGGAVDPSGTCSPDPCGGSHGGGGTSGGPN